MTFDKVVKGLYSVDIQVVCDTLNKAKHISNNIGEEIIFIHTGFGCQVQTGTLFEVLYSVSDCEIYYLKLKCSAIAPMGLPLILNTSQTPFTRTFYREDKKIEWFDRFNIFFNSFHPVLVKDCGIEDSKMNKLILANDASMQVSTFSIYEGYEKIKEYPLCRMDVPSFYLSYKGFSLLKRKYEEDSWGDDYMRDYGHSCEKYNGYNGWSDDVIDDAFGGIPEATWNVD